MKELEPSQTLSCKIVPPSYKIVSFPKKVSAKLSAKLLQTPDNPSPKFPGTFPLPSWIPFQNQSATSLQDSRQQTPPNPLCTPKEIIQEILKKISRRGEAEALLITFLETNEQMNHHFVLGAYRRPRPGL
jgi:hypothetical protein